MNYRVERLNSLNLSFSATCWPHCKGADWFTFRIIEKKNQIFSRSIRYYTERGNRNAPKMLLLCLKKNQSAWHDWVCTWVCEGYKEVCQRWVRECSSPLQRQTGTEADCQACSFPSGLTLSVGILFLQEINHNQVRPQCPRLFVLVSAQVFPESTQVSPLTQK